MAKPDRVHAPCRTQAGPGIRDGTKLITVLFRKCDDERCFKFPNTVLEPGYRRERPGINNILSSNPATYLCSFPLIAALYIAPPLALRERCSAVQAFASGGHGRPIPVHISHELPRVGNGHPVGIRFIRRFYGAPFRSKPNAAAIRKHSGQLQNSLPQRRERNPKLLDQAQR